MAFDARFPPVDCGRLTRRFDLQRYSALRRLLLLQDCLPLGPLLDAGCSVFLVSGADVFDGDKCFGIDGGGGFDYEVHLFSRGGQEADSDCSVSPSPDEFGDYESVLANYVGDLMSAITGDDANDLFSDGEFAFAPHTDPVADGESSSVSDHIERIIKFPYDAGNSEDPYRNFEETNYGSAKAHSTNDEDCTNCAHRDIGDSGKEDEDGQVSAVLGH